MHNESRELYPVEFVNLDHSDVASQMSDWDESFDWTVYFGHRGIEVYKMCVVGNPDIQGALALEYKEDHVWVHLIESAPHNRFGKVFDYVGENLMAYACLRSMELGCDGFIAFNAKTRLIRYYLLNMRAKRLGNGERMYIDGVAAEHLVQVYLKKR
ncbi:MAG TPA: hypothetical protein VMS09_17930 [Paenibacillus sp.]|uniref:hypothetical protein n=1 Tax=Paenibacillus sp. TaxID=58172 RepID=UPI0028D02936|nr:hypothetical protein [Paenibacillus sp.]HUC93865.1 hypothetical protein [Paenibacillus sp.]